MKRYVTTAPSKTDSLYNLLEYQKRKHYLMDALPYGIVGGSIFACLPLLVKLSMLALGSLPLSMGSLFFVFGAFFYGITAISQLIIWKQQCHSVQQILEERVKQIQQEDPELEVTVQNLKKAVSTEPKAKYNLGYVNEVYFQTQQNDIRVIREHVDENGKLLHHKLYTKNDSRWHQAYYVKKIVDGKQLVLRKKIERR